jgi:hypothetical protein
MPCWVIEVDRVIPHIAIAIPRLRIGRVGDEGVGLQKVVNIRRTHNFCRDKKSVGLCCKNAEYQAATPMTKLWRTITSRYEESGTEIA